MLPNGGQEFLCLRNQFLALDYLIFQFLAVLEIARIFFFSFLIIVNDLDRKIGYEEIDIALYLLAFQIDGVEGWIGEIVFLGQGRQELYSQMNCC